MKFSLEWARDFVALPEDLDPAAVAHDITMRTVEVEGFHDPSTTVDGYNVAQVFAVGDALVVSPTTSPADGWPVDSRAAWMDRLTAGTVVAAKPPTRSTASAILLLHDEAPEVSAIVGGGEGVIDLRPVQPRLGDDIGVALALTDWVFEIDNKSLTNRPDLWGHLGLARELAAIYGYPLATPAQKTSLPESGRLAGEVVDEICDQLIIVAFEARGAVATPLWLRSRLARLGVRSEDPYTALAQYVMYATGQPVEVYDADELDVPLCVRRDTTPVVADAKGPIAVAGVRALNRARPTSRTARVLYEIATYRPAVVREATQRLNLRTDASTRFEKGLDTDRGRLAVAFIASTIHQLGEISCEGVAEVVHRPTKANVIDLDVAFLQARIGQDIPLSRVIDLLTALGFDVAADGDRLRVIVPPWRSTGDVSIAHDLVEEVARLQGYDSFPAVPIDVVLRPQPLATPYALRRSIREYLAFAVGVNEVLTYPWALDALLDVCGYPTSERVRFDGAPAPDQQWLRPSLVPNLLEAVVRNLGHAGEFALFELGATFRASGHHGRPEERTVVAAAFVNSDPRRAFLTAKGALDLLPKRCVLDPFDVSPAAPSRAWADASGSASVCADGRQVGSLGLVTNRCRSKVGAEVIHIACFELDVDALVVLPSRENPYTRVPDFPDAKFDLSVVAADTVAWGAIERAAASASPLVAEIAFLNEFRGGSLQEGTRSLTFRVVLRSMERTLTGADIAAVRSQVLGVLEASTGAKPRV